MLPQVNYFFTIHAHAQLHMLIAHPHAQGTMHMHMHLLGILDTILATKGGDGVGTEPRYKQCLSMEDHSNKYCLVMYDYTICTKEAFDICTVYKNCCV